MRILSVWVFECIKLLLGGRRLHPLNAECPICHRMVRLHYIYSPTRAHTRAPCMKDRVTARTTPQRLNVLVRACWRSSTRARMKVNNSGCQNPLSSKAKQVLIIIEHCNECRFQPSMTLQLLRLGKIGFENVVFKHPRCSAVAIANWLGTCHTGASGSW